METTKTVYSIRAEIRDQNGKIVEDSNGRKITELKFEFEVDEDSLYSKQLKDKMEDFAKGLKAFLPTHKINLYASVHNSISGTWMQMAGYYGEEDRFVQF